jgi:hypothetical protein
VTVFVKMAAMKPKTKQIIKIAALLTASALFLFQGFSLLFSEQEKPKPEQLNSVK